MGSWNSGAPAPPNSVDDLFDVIFRRLNEIEAVPRGVGREAWSKAEIPSAFIEELPFQPAWRSLNDGRIEVRGRVKKASGAAIANGDVVLYLPYACVPPNSKDDPNMRSSVSALGIATIGAGGSGVCRFDMQRELAWTEAPLKDGYGNPVLDENGNPVMTPTSRVEVIARPPGGTTINGWVGFDNMIYDPNLYLDVLPMAEPGQSPLVPEPGTVVVQQPNGEIMAFPAGVKYV